MSHQIIAVVPKENHEQADTLRTPPQAFPHCSGTPEMPEQYPWR